MKLQVTVDKLNIRNNPVWDLNNHNWLGDLNKGAEVNAETIIEGGNYEGIKYWYKDSLNRYYWLGGVGNPDPNIGWSLNALGVPHVWNITKGETVKVAILDSGIANNTDLNGAVINRYNVLDGTGNVTDNFYHGTYCSTVLCSAGHNGVYGVAPGCELIVIKIMDTDDTPNDANQIAGIKKAIELGADIISMSFGSTSENSGLSTLLQQYMAQGKICIAAAGNNKNDGVNFPAKLKGVISVGNIGCINPTAAFGDNSFSLSDASPGMIDGPPYEGITIVAPGEGIKAYYLDGQILTARPGTSYAAPYVAGIAALWLSACKKKQISLTNRHQQFRDFIITNAHKNQTGYDPQTWGNGIINPLPILTI